MEVILKENERIDDLERNGYRIIQNSRKFCFGMDAVLLSGFAAEGEAARFRIRSIGLCSEDSSERTSGQFKTRLRIADLGTGTGIIPLLLHGKLMGPMIITASEKPETNRTVQHSVTTGKTRGSENVSDIQWKNIPIIGLEIQEEMADMAARSVQLNGLEQEIEIIRGDICQASDILGKGQFDVVTSNPPYMKHGSGISNPDSSKAISRHEILCTFEDVAVQAAALLKPNGRFYLVHRPERLAELIETLRKSKLEPKRMRMVHSFADSEATMVLIESAKGGGTFMKVEKPLIIYKEKDVYTDEILQIYYY